MLHYTRIAKVQAEVGNPVEALKTLESLSDASLDRVEVLRDITVAEIKIGLFEEARRTLDLLNADPGTFSQMGAVMAIAVAYARAGRLEDAMKTIEPIGGLMYRSVVLREIALAQAQIGSYAQAWKVANMIEEKEAKGTALHGIGLAQAKAGDVMGTIERSRKQVVPFEKAQALLGVAEGILDQRNSMKH